MKMNSKNRIIRQKELSELLGVSVTTLYRMQDRGQLPPRRKVSSNVVGWLESDINEWLQQIPEMKVVNFGKYK